MDFSFAVDLISDLNLTADDEFDWDGKATSLFCVVAGNISTDLTVVESVLKNLSQYYRGVLYIDGALENTHIENSNIVIEKLRIICKPIPNVVYLHNHVIILNGVAFIGINGWYNTDNNDADTALKYFDEDFTYLSRTVKSLQDHQDATRIVVVSSCLPSKQITFNDPTVQVTDQMGLIMCLSQDIKHKIDTWLFGSYKRMIDHTFNSRRYCNNPKMHNPYHPKKIPLA